VPHSTLTPADAEAIAKPVRRFIADRIIPREQEAFAAGVDDKLRIQLQQLAHHAGVLAPQAPAEYMGGGAEFVTTVVLPEEAGYRPLGPLAMNCAARDEGNLHLLAVVGTAEQKERCLRPLVRGDMRSCVAMTEPPPGAGSAPAALTSTAHKCAGGWLLDGDKHFITGADGAGFAIVMAKSQGPGVPEGASMFLIEADNPGWQVGNRMRTIDAGTVGGHCHVQLRGAFVGDDAVLGERGRGFAHAQVRLVPARLTQCMRWPGTARRAHDVALRRASCRELFGAPLGSLGMAQQLIADNEIELVACRALLWQVAAQVAQGVKGTEESPRAKIFISDATGRIVDRAVQLAGGTEVTEESAIGHIYADIRAFRIYDGPSEAHRAAIARRAVTRIQRASA
jgi:acyl-CoA dehydrogenase